MALTKEKLIPLVILGALILALPVALILTRKSQDIRPKALLGAANFKLNADKTSVSPGETFRIIVSAQVTNTNAKVSGVDFTLLYDRTKLRLVNAVQDLGSNFTDTPVFLNQELPYPSEGNGSYNFIRMVRTVRKSNTNLPSGTIPITNMTFEVLAGATGQALIKFPNDSSVLQVVGSN